jgi:hypothetical protein
MDMESLCKAKGFFAKKICGEILTLSDGLPNNEEKNPAFQFSAIFLLLWFSLN